MQNFLRQDLEHILENTKGIWEELRNSNVFITGGTGFVGSWLLESFLWANDELNLNAFITVLTRDPNKFCKKLSHLAEHPSVKLYKGDILSFDFPQAEFSHIIHGATEASEKLNTENPLLMMDTIVNGTRRVLDFAISKDVKNFLFISSGAIYGKQPYDIDNMPEDYRGAPNSIDPISSYGEGKRIAELMCSIYAQKYGLEIKIARCFAFVGPYLPLDAHFAIGNFIKNFIEKKPIEIKGDGSPLRSYLYAADLAIWLWHILIRGRSCVPYNVGSDQSISILELAKLIANCSEPALPIVVAKKPKVGNRVERYVPSVSKVKSDFNIQKFFSLKEAIEKTINFNKMLWMSALESE